MAFDTVTVPDFNNPKVAARFEARTLLFLAAWLENAGEARNFPLHLACIGQPPPSVTWLAAQCYAHITSHAPMPTAPTSNKLRGLEIQGQADHVLLLDVDVITLADPSAISDLGAGLAAMAAIWPHVPEAYWRRIYAALSLEPPTERIPSLIGALDRVPMRKPLYPAQNAEAPAMIPYFNSGVVYAPWACELRRLWERGLHHFVAMVDRADPLSKAILNGDQGGFALAVELLKRQGVPFRALPYPYHTVWLHIYRRAATIGQAKFYHAMNVFAQASQPENFEAALVRFRLRMLKRIVTEWGREMALRPNAATLGRYCVPALRESYQLGLRLHQLYRKHVSPALKHGNAPRHAGARP